MYNHEPERYACPFCRIVRDSASPEVICQNEMATAFVSLARWPRNPVNILVVPNEHFENLYDLPLSYAPAIHALTHAVALALKAVYHCDGVSTRQHNEPAGGQDVWHYHVHVTPRSQGDHFYRVERIPFPEAERHAEARRLREYFEMHPTLLAGAGTGTAKTPGTPRIPGSST